MSRIVDDAYLMWYGSYWSGRPHTTALGFAASIDGLKWYKHADNPVLRPDQARPWESHYVTSQSVARLPDGSFRLWYASRKKPPFVNKYFAINTAIWIRATGDAGVGRSSRFDPLQADADAFRRWQTATREQLRQTLGIPRERIPLDAEKRGEFQGEIDG